ncbi:hypothetical protein MYCO108962_24845 [Mycobacterium colombiense]
MVVRVDQRRRRGLRAGEELVRVVGHGAVRESVRARLRRDFEVARRHGQRVDRPGAGILRVGQGRGGGREQRCVRRRQRRAAGQGRVRFLGRGQRQGGRRLEGGLDQRDVDAGADDEHGVRARLQVLGAGHHRGQLGDRRLVIVGQDLPLHIGNGSVRAVDHRQRRGVGLDVEQRGLRVVGLVADRLGQRRRGQEGRDEHHIFDLVGGQLVAQRGGLDRVRERDTGRRELVAALCCALTGPQDGRDYLVRGGYRCCICVSGDVEIVFINRRAVAVFPLDQHHPDCRRGHRHTKYGVQSSSNSRLLANHGGGGLVARRGGARHR